MKNKIKKLTSSEIKLLKKQYQSLTFQGGCDLVYETQIPNTGIVLINGELALFRKKKLKTKVQPGSLLGVHELVHNIPVEHSCKVLGNSELIMIQKSDIIEALSDESSDLYCIIKDSLD